MVVEKEFSQCHPACPNPLSKADKSEHGPSPTELSELAASSQLLAAARIGAIPTSALHQHNRSCARGRKQ